MFVKPLPKYILHGDRTGNLCGLNFGAIILTDTLASPGSEDPFKTCPFPPSCPSFHSNSFPTLSGEGMAAGSGTQNLSPPLLCPALPPWSRSIKSSESSRPPSVSAKPPSSFGSSLLPPFSFSRSLLRVLDRPTDPPLPSLTCYATCDSSEPVSLSVSSPPCHRHRHKIRLRVLRNQTIQQMPRRDADERYATDHGDMGKKEEGEEIHSSLI